jgi:hypothetical protein
MKKHKNRDRALVLRYSLNTTVFQELVQHLIGLAQRKKGRAKKEADRA